jgi:hypothetical protein
VFSATYDNYRILFRGLTASDIVLVGRLRLSGTDDTSSNYQHQRIEANGTSVSAFRETNATSARLGAVLSTNCVMSYDVYRPAIAAPTQFIFHSGFRTTSALQISVENSVHNVSTAYDGITFFPASSTMTGSVSIYGYAKA